MGLASNYICEVCGYEATVSGGEGASEDQTQDASVPLGKRGGKSRYAAAWLWSLLTEGDYRCSPGFREKDGETERELYRRFVKQDLPALEVTLERRATRLVGGWMPMIR